MSLMRAVDKKCARLQCEWLSLDLLANNAGVCMSAEIGEGEVAAWQRVNEYFILAFYTVGRRWFRG
jgi:NADP-dependent 3-hydroxy acid dehydrogenase YdfG